MVGDFFFITIRDLTKVEWIKIGSGIRYKCKILISINKKIQ